MLTKSASLDVCKFAESNKIHSLLKRKGCLSCCNYHACVASTIHMLVVKGSREWQRTTPLKWSNWWLRGCPKSWNPKPFKRNLGESSMWVSSIRQASQLYARRTTLFQGQLLTCCRWRRFQWWTTQVQSDKPNVANVYLLNLLSLLSPKDAFSSFSIFNFFAEATSPGAAGFPGGQIDPRQSPELANEESEMLKSRNRVRLNPRTMKSEKALGDG